jgi:biopolymer transport protein ExbB
MTFDLAHIWAHMSLLSKTIAFALLLMALASVGVVVERFIAFAKAHKAATQFMKASGPALESWNLPDLEVQAAKFPASPLAGLFGAMTRRYLAAGDDPGNMSAAELARNEAHRKLEAIGAELRRGMSILASVGSVAPFIGLLGTVVGIIAAFAGIGAAGNAGIGAVSAGISEALIETAFGLMVAIPAVLFYNYLSTRVAGIELSLTRSVGELLDEMENNHGRKASKHLGKPEKAA